MSKEILKAGQFLRDSVSSWDVWEEISKLWQRSVADEVDKWAIYWKKLAAKTNRRVVNWDPRAEN